MRIPGYLWRPVVGLANDPVIEPVLVILHTDAGNSPSLYDWFNGPSRGIESHAHIPKSDDHEPEQYRGTEREADANYAANSWVKDGVRYGAISIETQGTGREPWTPYQLGEIKRTLRILHEEHGIPLKPATGAHGKGIGYHTMFPSWSNVPGKTCPGPQRIRQFHEVLVPWMAEQRRSFYVVKPGDTVTTISRKTGVPPARLWKLNRPHVKAGERLRLN